MSQILLTYFIMFAQAWQINKHQPPEQNHKAYTHPLDLYHRKPHTHTYTHTLTQDTFDEALWGINSQPSSKRERTGRQSVENDSLPTRSILHSFLRDIRFMVFLVSILLHTRTLNANRHHDCPWPKVRIVLPTEQFRWLFGRVGCADVPFRTERRQTLFT